MKHEIILKYLSIILLIVSIIYFMSFSINLYQEKELTFMENMTVKEMCQYRCIGLFEDKFY